MSRHLIVRLCAWSLTALLLGGSAVTGYHHFYGPTEVRAIFTSAPSIYTGDDVRVAGVKVGTITAIHPQGATAELTLTVDHDVHIPADAKAVVVAENLISARYVQLTPPYDDHGPTMRDGTVIPLQRTAVPVEWDEVKDQLNRLAITLGPEGNDNTGTLGRFIDSAAGALGGNGDKLRQTLAQLSGTARILAGGSGNLVDIIKGLQVFVTALRDSNEQIVQVEGRLATLSSVLDGSRSDLDAALTNLSVAVENVQRFVATTRDKTSEQVTRLAAVTQNLADHKADLEELLHIFPNAIANFYNMYDPNSGTVAGTFIMNNFSNPIQMMCSAMVQGANGNPMEGAKKCAEYLGPALRTISFNGNPIPFSPLLAPVALPDRLIYTDPSLAPGGANLVPGSAAVPSLPDLLLPAGVLAP